MAMKMILTPARTPDEYLCHLDGWQQAYVQALWQATREAAPVLESRLKWGHLVLFHYGPVALIRAEPHRVLFGFWRGKQLRHIEPRLKAGGKYDMATLELRQDTPLDRETVQALVREATRLNRELGDPTAKVVER
ncbi:DUF1801 domain-containing protein [Variovorax sp. KK3]|uniref:DUF1801 domain-containing protein n=1 Tax=Variovorax sp. KK3 TaxID=1855728 RepID=UPI00097BE45F|nr:DUF1801 domain-containing protein [Variovorax sp. KK3]